MERGRARQQVEGLEDEADLAVADRGQLVVVHLRDDLAAQHVAPLAGRVEAADQVHQGRLAGARRPHDRHVLAALDLEGDAAQRVDLLGAHLVGAPEVLGVDDRPVHGCARRRCSRLLPLLLDLHARLVLEVAQRLVGAGHDLLALGDALGDLDVGLAHDAGLDRLEDGLLALDHEDAVLLHALLARASATTVSPSRVGARRWPSRRGRRPCPPCSPRAPPRPGPAPRAPSRASRS